MSLKIILIILLVVDTLLLTFPDFIKNNLNTTLIIMGWYVAFITLIKGQDNNLKNQSKIKIYEELSNIKSELDEVSIKLSIAIMPFSLPWSELLIARIDNRGEDFINIWQNYIKKIYETRSEFTSSYRKLWKYCDVWIGLIHPLENTKNTLFKELGEAESKISPIIKILQDKTLDIRNWESWDKTELEGILKTLSNELDITIFNYPEQFMTLVHNELVTPILGYKAKPFIPKLTAGSKYKILTENGVEERTM